MSSRPATTPEPQWLWREMRDLLASAGGLFLLGDFQLLAMVRYRFEFDWGAGRIWVYVLGLVSLFALGVYSWLRVEFRP
ncbi:MAG: hypothetical protein M3124_04530 [Actinomycetota bacterium]|nr:hypothetical protein [Actinomycetota bacterium]